MKEMCPSEMGKSEIEVGKVRYKCGLKVSIYNL